MKPRLRAICAGALLALMQATPPMAAEPPGADTFDDSGTTIVNDREAAVGLDLTPWKEETAADIDRAPGRLDEKPAPLDVPAFKRRVANADALAAYRRAQLEQNRD